MIKTFEQFTQSTNEGWFTDWLTGKREKGAKDKKSGEPNVVDAAVEDFYKTLQDFANSGKSIQVEPVGSMQYSKMVEDIQAALSFLGYDFPVYGVDGLFGPETAAAIRKFNDDTVKKDDKVDESIIKTFESYYLNEAANGLLADSELMTVSSPGKTGGSHKLNKQAAEAYDQMKKAAEADGITWGITDSYRDYEGQVAVAAKKGLYKNGGLAAVPGTSNHGWGSALDLDLTTAASDWLKANAATYGFSTIPREPWHWEHKDSVEFAKSGKEGSPKVPVLIDADLINRLISKLKERGFSQKDLDKFAAKKKSATIDLNIKDFDGIVAQVIDKLEGGYYHPDMLADGRVKDSRYGASGETMMGIDRKAGGSINTTPEGIEFWNLIDSENARSTWKWGYRGGSLESKLTELAGKMIKRNYDEYAQRYLSPEAMKIVNANPKLLFNFVYAVWNGPGWFQKFARTINDAVTNGTIDPEELAKIAVDARLSSGNSLIAQGGRKIEDLLNTSVA